MFIVAMLLLPLLIKESSSFYTISFSNKKVYELCKPIVNKQCKSKSFTFLRLSNNDAADDNAQGWESGKGFGKKKEKVVELPPENLPVDKVDNFDNSDSAMELEEAIKTTNYFKNTMNKREVALDEKIARLKEEQDLIDSDPSVGAVPELVANRMISRIAAFFGIPVFGGLMMFVAFFFISKKYDLIVPPAIVAYATQVPFIIGLAGISYGILSSSWDEAPGSTLGWKEFNINVQRIKDGFQRTKDNAQLKDVIEIEKKKLGRKK